MPGFLIDLQWRCLDRAVAVKGETGDAAERRDVLILLADRLLEPLDLDVARLLGELAWAPTLRAPTS
jgi:hypothetical protein